MTTLEIESFFGDCVLSGPELSRKELEAQIFCALHDSSGNRDKLVGTLCGRFGWSPAGPGARPLYRYDLDVEMLFAVQ